jgi:hypothetical protein
MKKESHSSTNLHNFKTNIYVGFLGEDALELSPNEIEVSFFGGTPIWLEQPKP